MDTESKTTSTNSKKDNKKRKDTSWVVTIILWSILISGSVNLLSDVLLRNVNILVAFIILIFIVILGVMFDIIGVAVTAAEEKPFHAKAAKKLHGAKIAVKLIRNADKVSNFCNDVVGDICGIVSGGVGALILAKIVKIMPELNAAIISAVIGSIIAAATIGGKAVGKSFAISQSNKIIDKVSKIIYFIKKDR